ncbi:hypothetical protein P4C99_12245 [Pontiellaceae bacterium B1224]|nr:hypothetical protein [Pontiellaceae bacterium B1224]
MKLKKTLKIALGALGVLFLLFILTLLFWLGPTVKMVAQVIGPKALGTPLQINKLSINPIKGTVHLSDFSIKNPTMFGQSNAVSLASLDLAIDMGTIFSSTVVVHQVQINSPYFIYEQNLSSDNITEFINSIQEFAGIDLSAAPTPEKEKKKGKKPKEPKIVVVKSLEINDVQFNLANTHDAMLDIGAGFEQLAISMTNGTVRLDNFYVNNPQRLETPDLFSLEQVEILMEPGSIYSSNIIIHAIDIRKPHAYVEHNPETDTAWEFLKIAESLVVRIPTSAPINISTNEVVVAETEPPPEVILGRITIDDVQLNVVNIGDPELDMQLGLEQLAIAMQDGRIDLNNLFLTNPKRMAIPNLFSLDHITVDFDPTSIAGETVVINDIQIKRPYAFLELNKTTDTVAELMKIANGFVERVPKYPVLELPPPPAGNAMETPESPTAPPVALHNLTVDDIQVKLLDTTPTNNVPTEPHTLAGIGSISVKLVDGKIQVHDITAPNEPSYFATNLFHLANLEIDIAPDSLFSDQVVIDRVWVDSPIVNLEQTEESGNVAALQMQLMRFAPPLPEGAEEEVVPTVPAAADPEVAPILLAEQPVVLHQLIVTNLNVSLKFPVDTNATDNAQFGIDLNKLNPASMVSLNKLNPLAGDSEEEQEVDPDAAITLVAFNTLSVEPLKGVVDIHDLRVSNPPGFSRRSLMKLEEFRIDLDPDTLQSDVLSIKDIVLTNPRVRYERQILKDNIKALQEEIEQATVRRDESMEDPESENAASEEDGDKKEQKVVIDRVAIDGCIVYAKLSALPAIPIPVPIPDLKDIGKDKGGATPAEASTQIVDNFYNEMINAVGNTTGFASDALKGFGNLTLGTIGLDGSDEDGEESEETAEEPETEEKTKRTIRRPGAKTRRF